MNTDYGPVRCPHCDSTSIDETTMGWSRESGQRNPNTMTCTQCGARGNAQDWEMLHTLTEGLREAKASRTERDTDWMRP